MFRVLFHHFNEWRRILLVRVMLRNKIQDLLFWRRVLIMIERWRSSILQVSLQQLSLRKKKRFHLNLWVITQIMLIENELKRHIILLKTPPKWSNQPSRWTNLNLLNVQTTSQNLQKQQPLKRASHSVFPSLPIKTRSPLFKPMMKTPLFKSVMRLQKPKTMISLISNRLLLQASQPINSQLINPK